MADKLIFPIGFDIESAVRSAEVEGTRAVKRLEDLFSRQPLILKTESKGFAELGQDIDTLKARLKEIQTQWNQMPTAAKFDLDADGNIKKLTAEGKELWDELLRITTALQGVGQTITQFAKESSKALAEETRFAEQMRQAEINRYNETARAKNKEMADDEKRYQKWLANKEKEVQKEQEAAQRKQNAQERAANAARKAQRDEAIEAYKINTALKAREDVLSNLATKLQILQQRIQSQQVGTDAWNKTALEIRRVNEELQKANQQMQDFQQKAFQGLSDSLTKGKVDALTRYREQLRQIEADFNRLNQTGGAFNSTGGLTSAANDILRQRQAIIKQINQMLTTAADAQIQREKEINAVIEQRKAKQAQIKAQHQAELAALKQKRAENDRIRKVLAGQENTISNITAKLQIQQQRLSTTEVGSAKFEKIAKEVERLTNKLEDANKKMRELTGQTTKSTDKQVAAYNKQTTYLERLIKRLAVYASIGAMGTFLRNVREVTAQFELQRVSLGAIIQDQQRANQLFSEIKAFALKSPLKILDLTKYTKQVAAYRIETDKLFDTTKRLADVSVGLGVDMGRLVLAYGPVKAASYLRAAEIRQFTEAGIPLLELLAEKFTQLQGTVVSTEEVMDKVSKRMVSFSMVEEIFKDMTDAGGMFYNMQEKQSQTLYGMWAKMGDAAAVMYEQMGNTATANNAMKEVIQLMSDMMLHWTALANVAQTAAIGFVGYKAAMVGLLPTYGLALKQTINQVTAEKMHQVYLNKKLQLFAKLTQEQMQVLKNEKKLTEAEWEQVVVGGKLNQVTALKLARLAKEDKELTKVLITQKLYTQEQLTQIQAMSKGQLAMAKMKAGMLGIGEAARGVWASMKAWLPIMANLLAWTAVIDLFMDWRQATKAQEDAIRKVDKQYEETKITLMQIENAYRDIQAAAKAAGENEEEFAKTSYSQKLEQLKKVIKLLGQFGMKNVIDPSVLNYTNIDPVLENWLAKLKEVNELSRSWGREVSQVANAYEGNIFGWSIFGENLKEDMKDLERAWTKLTVNSQFNTALEQLRAIVGEMSNANKEVYDNISKAIGADLKLALGQKRRNESELQYQQRIYKNYQNIEGYLQTFLKKGEYKGMLPSLSSADVNDVLADFQSQVDEVMHEFDKVKEKFRGQDALTVKMAIDTVAAENDWTEWQKELLIQHLNEDPITLNAELIPTVDAAGQGAVAEGLKAIITSEFPTLFNEDELQSLVSVEGIVDAIKAKLDASNEKLEKSVQLQNNLTYGSKGYEASLERITQLQDEITEVENMRAELAELEAIEGEKSEEQILRQSELQAKLQEIDDASINTKRAQIAAIVEANAKYDEQIQKQRESAETEREIAKAALERVTSMGLSDLGKDVKQQFGDLIVDAVKEITDNNYSTDFLISDDELKKVRDVADLYEVWAKNTKAVKDEKEKLVGVGINEATIEKERAELEKKRAQTQLQLSAVEAEIANEKFKGQESEYAKLKLAIANATTTEAQRVAQENLNRFLGDTKNAEFAILMLKKEGLKTSLQETLASQAANDQIAEYIKGLDDAEELWKKLGERYNFQLQDKDKKRGGGEDPWILLMKNRMKFMQDFQKGVENLSKWMGYTKGLIDEQENMLGRGLSLQIDSRQLDGTKEELIQWYEDSIAEIRKRIAKLGGKEWEGLGVQMILAKDTKSRVIKKYQELLADMFKELTDFRTDQAQKELEKKLKSLSDKIARSKTAQDFFNKILDQTGDVDVAINMTTSVYGTSGGELQDEMADYIRSLFGDVSVDTAIEVGTSNVDYTELETILNKNVDIIAEKNAEVIRKLIEDGRKANAAQVQQWFKDIKAAEDFADKRVKLARETAKRIAEVEAQARLQGMGEAEKDALISGYKQREDKEAAKLEYEAFKEMPMYVQLFSDLDNASTAMLTNMRDNLIRLQGQWQNLDPTQLKELQSRLADIEKILISRNPFKKLGESISKKKEWKQLHGDVSKLETELNTATNQWLEYSNALTEATNAEADAKAALENAKVNGGDVKAAEEVYEATKEKTAQAAKNLKLSKEEVETLQKLLDKWKKLNDEEEDAGEGINKYIEAVRQALNETQSMVEAWSTLGDDELWNVIMDGLDSMLSAAESAVTAFTAGDPFTKATAAVSAITGIIGTIGNIFYGAKIARANKEIERQQKILDQLEYSYNRLENAIDKTFGTAYLQAYRQQLANLQAQQNAYLKQAEAERSKGKKADKDKIKDYEDSARDAADAIADMQGTLAEKFLGSDLASAARDFAQAWIDAYKEFGNTADAMSEKFQEMIQNMIVESLLGSVMEKALKPAFDMIDNMKDSDFMNQSFWESLTETAAKAAQNADAGAYTMMSFLEQAGITMRDLGSDLTGISRDVATASEESINGLAAGINTQNFYISQQLAEVRLIREAIVNRGDSGVIYTDLLAMQNEHLSHLPIIAANTAATVERCERAALACEDMASQLRRVIRPKQEGNANYVLNTKVLM